MKRAAASERRFRAPIGNGELIILTIRAGELGRGQIVARVSAYSNEIGIEQLFAMAEGRAMAKGYIVMRPGKPIIPGILPTGI